MALIEFENLTKDYGNGKGVFHISFQVEKGEAFGYLGPNGAGKTTSIRHLLGFLRPDEGEVRIEGQNTFKYHYMTNSKIGYLPGEISFPDNMSGTQILEWCRNLKQVKDTRRQDELIEYFEFSNIGMKVKRMSKGMKQKLGIVCAFMNDPDILILDEPTTGLDPLMQHKFIELLHEEKEKGKTIFLSSHIFSEIERTCNRVAIVKGGSIATILDMDEILDSKIKEFDFTLKEKQKIVSTDKLNFTSEDGIHYHVIFNREDINVFTSFISGLDILIMNEKKDSIEEHFMKFYEKEGK